MKVRNRQPQYGARSEAVHPHFNAFHSLASQCRARGSLVSLQGRLSQLLTACFLLMHCTALTHCTSKEEPGSDNESRRRVT